jgi:hypothetical protein
MVSRVTFYTPADFHICEEAAKLLIRLACGTEFSKLGHFDVAG